MSQHFPSNFWKNLSTLLLWNIKADPEEVQQCRCTTLLDHAEKAATRDFKSPKWVKSLYLAPPPLASVLSGTSLPILPLPLQLLQGDWGRESSRARATLRREPSSVSSISSSRWVPPPWQVLPGAPCQTRSLERNCCPPPHCLPFLSQEEVEGEREGMEEVWRYQWAGRKGRTAE